MLGQPDDVVSVCPLTSLSAAAAGGEDGDDDDKADDDDTVTSTTDAGRDTDDSSAEKSMTSSMTSRSRDCRRTRLIGSTSRNCTKPRRNARSAAAIFAFCFVKPTPSNV